MAARLIPQWEIIDYARDDKGRCAERHRARTRRVTTLVGVHRGLDTVLDL